MSLRDQFKAVELQGKVAELERSLTYLRTAARNALVDLDDGDFDAVREALRGIAGERGVPDSIADEEGVPG